MRLIEARIRDSEKSRDNCLHVLSSCTPESILRAVKMSVARPSQCVFCLFRRSARPVISRKRSLHTTPTRRKEKTDEKVDEKTNQKTEKKPTVEKLDITKEGRRFRQIKKGEWEQNYSPEQVEAIEAASKLINPENFTVGKGAPRTDPWSMNYYDNFEKINPVVDKPIRAPMTNIDDTQRMKTEEEFDQDLAKLMENLPAFEQEGVNMFEEFDKNLRLTTGREEAERNPPSAMAPMIPSPEKATKKSDTFMQERTPEPALIQLMQMTGIQPRRDQGAAGQDCPDANSHQSDTIRQDSQHVLPHHRRKPQWTPRYRRRESQ